MFDGGASAWETGAGGIREFDSIRPIPNYVENLHYTTLYRRTPIKCHLDPIVCPEYRKRGSIWRVFPELWRRWVS
jgi:hypothetical protein